MDWPKVISIKVSRIPIVFVSFCLCNYVLQINNHFTHFHHVKKNDGGVCDTDDMILMDSHHIEIVAILPCNDHESYKEVYLNWLHNELGQSLHHEPEVLIRRIVKFRRVQTNHEFHDDI